MKILKRLQEINDKRVADKMAKDTGYYFHRHYEIDRQLKEIAEHYGLSTHDTYNYLSKLDLPELVEERRKNLVLALECIQNIDESTPFNMSFFRDLSRKAGSL